MSAPTSQPATDQLVELHIDRVAHGGHCVARLDGRVVFVRHCLPGEQVLAVVSPGKQKDSFWRAETAEVIDPSPDRVPSVWPAAGIGGVGGGELAHVALAAQRQWKTTVLREQLTRLGGLTPERVAEVTVAGVPGDDDRNGLGYRTRIELSTTAHGELGMFRHRSHAIVPLDDMPLAVPGIAELELFDRTWPRRAEVKAICPVGGDRPLVLVNGQPWQRSGADNRPGARRTVKETVTCQVAGQPREYAFKVAGAGFWQVHDQAPALLIERVTALLADAVAEGSVVADLYSGAGLLTAPLADLVGEPGTVIAVEQDGTAVRDARRRLAGRPQVTFVTEDVATACAGEVIPDRLDAVVLDPPRAGAGKAVLAQVAARRVPRVVYVACDPAALARDIAYLRQSGYDLVAIEGHDLFPHTHHFETLAVFDWVG